MYKPLCAVACAMTLYKSLCAVACAIYNMGVGRGLEVGGGGANARSRGLEAVQCTYVTMG